MTNLQYGIDNYGSEPQTTPLVTAPVKTKERCWILRSREIDLSTLEASSELATAPVSYLLDIQPQKKWRAGDFNSWLKITLVKPTACNALATIGANFSDAAVWRLSAAINPANLLTAPDFVANGGFQSVWKDGQKPDLEDWDLFTNVIRFDNDTPYQNWVLEIGDPANPYNEVGRLFLAREFVPAINIGYGAAIGINKPDLQSITDYGQIYTDPRGAAFRRMTIPFQCLSEDEMMDFMMDLQRYCGLAKDFVFSMAPGDTPAKFQRKTMQALFSQLTDFTTQPSFDAIAGTWTQSINIVQPS